MPPNSNEVCEGASFSGRPELDSKLAEWLEWTPPESSDHEAVKGLIEDGDFDQLEKMMMSRKTFGTAGIRARMGPGFACLNDLVIIQTTQGLAKYVLECNKPQPGQRLTAVVGHDARHNSKRWSRLVAGAFLRCGFDVVLFSGVTPTPWVPFVVQRTESAAVGVMVTASHNPKEDNGYKVYWGNGPQIIPPHNVNIQNCILENLPPAAGADAFEEAFLERFSQRTVPSLVDGLERYSSEYYDDLRSFLYDEAMNEGSGVEIVYSAMHGVGANFLDRAFKVAGFSPVVHVKKQREPDPEFPTVKFPNPEEGKGALSLSMDAADECGANYILANDPDADRLAVAERNGKDWHVFTGNEIGSLLGYWQMLIYTTKFEMDKSDLVFVNSAISSKMLRSMARKEQMVFEETLTGFKWMANRAQRFERDDGKTVLLCYEEAIGFMCGTRVLDKDGVFAAVRMAELLAFLERQGKTLLQQLDELYDRYGFHCVESSYLTILDHKKVAGLFNRLRNYPSPNGRSKRSNGDGPISPQYPRSVPTADGISYMIASVCDQNTGFDSANPDHVATLPVSLDGDWITFTLNNGIVVTLRTSGTEPKLKYYVEYCGKPGDNKSREAVKTLLNSIVGGIIDEFIQPQKNNLVFKQ